VEGEGVIGQQPVLEPGETYQYVSGCNLRTALGKMKGNYLMERLEDKKQFYINIPSFVLAAPLKLN
jgi:ApaG protein